MIIGSMRFAQDMVKVKKQLEDLGHKVSVPFGTKPHLEDKTFVENLEGNLAYCIENNVMRKNFIMIAKNDAVLVLNHKRNSMEGYIGTSALLEMGIAHYLKKKIFLFQKTPNYKDVRWAHEVAIMQPTVIDGDLGKIK